MTDIIERLNDSYDNRIKVEELPLVKSLITALISYYTDNKMELLE